MPELAEVQTLAWQLRQVAAGRRIEALTPLRASWLQAGDASSLSGVTVATVSRWGKRLRFSMEDGQQLVVGLGMTGGFRVRKTTEAQDKHTVAEVLLEDGVRLDYVDPRRFGRAHLFADDAQAVAVLGGRIGVDAASRMTFKQLRELLAHHGGRALKAALLDQGGNGRGLSGLGNYLCDEMAWEARLHPERTVSSLTDREWIRLNRARMQVLLRALNAQGLSFSDYRHADGGEGQMLGKLRAYGRAGAPCLRCGTSMVKSVVAGRGTHHCPTCQPAAVTKT